MSVVVDASLLVAALVDTGAAGAWAETIIAGGELHAPELVLAEAANVLRRLEAGRHISDAGAAFEDLMQLDLALHPFEAFADRIWELRRNLTACDAWYVAVSEAFSLPLATLDARLARTKSVRCRVLTR